MDWRRCRQDKGWLTCFVAYDLTCFHSMYSDRSDGDDVSAKLHCLCGSVLQYVKLTLPCPQTDATATEMGKAAADAADTAYDTVADAQDARRDGDGSSSAGFSGALDDTMLQQRTYFVPVLVCLLN